MLVPDLYSATGVQPGQPLGQYGGSAQSQGVAEGTYGFGSPIGPPPLAPEHLIPQYDETPQGHNSNISLASGGAFMLGMVILARSGFRA